MSVGMDPLEILRIIFARSGGGSLKLRRTSNGQWQIVAVTPKGYEIPFPAVPDEQLVAEIGRVSRALYEQARTPVELTFAEFPDRA